MDEEALAVPMRAWVIGFASIVTGVLGLFLFSANQGLGRGLPERIDDIIEAHNLMRPDNFKEPSIANWGAKQLVASVTEGSPIRDYEILNIRTMFPLSQARVTLSLKLEVGRSRRVRLYFVGYTCTGAYNLDKEGRATPYFERSFGGWTRSYPFGDDPLAVSGGGFIWDEVLRRRMSFRNSGEFDYAEPSKKEDYLTILRDFESGQRKVKFTQKIGVAQLGPPKSGYLSRYFGPRLHLSKGSKAINS